MRRFSLIDADGKTYDLTEKTVSFFYDAEGLGYEREIEYRQIGDRFAILSDFLGRSEISGTVKFWNPGAQKQYREFVRFCQNTPLTLVYNADGTEYRKKGMVTQVEYTEEDCLTVGITFSGLAPYYREITSRNQIGEAQEGKIYKYTYPYWYTSTLGNTVVIDSDSYIESPCRLTMNGPLSNPFWTHYVNNLEHCSGKVNAEIPKGCKIVVDTTEIPYSIKEYNLSGELVADLYQASDFGTNRFTMLQHGQNRITVTDDNGRETDISVEGRIYYASV